MRSTCRKSFYKNIIWTQNVALHEKPRNQQMSENEIPAKPRLAHKSLVVGKALAHASRITLVPGGAMEGTNVSTCFAANLCVSLPHDLPLPFLHLPSKCQQPQRCPANQRRKHMELGASQAAVIRVVVK